MSEFTDLSPARRKPQASEPKALRFALVMLAGCVVVTLVVGVLLRENGPSYSTVAAPRAGIARR